MHVVVSYKYARSKSEKTAEYYKTDTIFMNGRTIVEIIEELKEGYEQLCVLFIFIDKGEY